MTTRGAGTRRNAQPAAAVDRRSDRIELRTTREEKQLLAAAAAHERMDLTTFVLRTVLPTAQTVVEQASRIILSARDTTRVLELLENPPEPGPRLRRAVEARRRSEASHASARRSPAKHRRGR
jgi:uncharacterized protein (DUF1778 family)